MKQKTCSRIFAALFLLCTVTLAAAAGYRAYTKPVIGGAGIPTVLFTLRQMLQSPFGSVTAGLGALSLIACILSYRKKP